ncbi:MAG: ABC transporter substrate-binding protein [Clostridia bacterium]|nr:ABC transporter substrate-binding protein [Clostridia bacterium]
MKKIIALLLAAAMLMTACAALADEAFIIGSIGPTTGPYAQYGSAVENAAKLCADEINALGGVQFTVLGEDDQGDGELAVNAYNKLMDEGMDILLGTVTSGACMAVASVANEERLFMLTPSASNDLVNQSGDQIFQVCFTDSNQGAGSAEWIKANRPEAKVGIIYNNALDYSIGITNSFENTAKEIGLEIIAKSAFSDDAAADFSVQVAAMKDAGVDFVFLPIYYTPAITILTQAKAADYAPTFFGVDGMDGVLEVEGLDQSLVQGVYMLTPFDATATDEMTVNFVTKYVELYGATPNQFAADAYDGMYVLKLAIETAGLTADMSYEDMCEKLVEVMPTLHYKGLTGDMTWSADGTVSKLPNAVMIEGDHYVSAE